MPFSQQEKKRFIQIETQRELLRVSPKLEVLRAPCRIKGARGGRGAGAKSWGFTSLITQKAHHKSLRITCLREIQKTLEESAHYLFSETIDRLGYSGWSITDKHINSDCGSHIIFRGMKDYRTARGAKGLEGFDIFYVEEASALSRESWEILLPTLFRKETAELWFCYNPEDDPDPVTELIWDRYQDDPNAILIELEPGKKDNPWWNQGLQDLMDKDFEYDPDLAAHVWLGQPRKQGFNSVMSRVSVESAMRRNIVEPVGTYEAGVDVARFGDDRSVGYLRKGPKIIENKGFCVKGFDTIQVANAVWDMVDRKPFIPIKIDAGYNPGVIDVLRSRGAKVREVNFGGKPSNKNKYTSAASEMWFEFPIDDADIPNDPELRRELCGRLYDYEKITNRKVIEPKSKYKERLGYSPDKADALLLCFYDGGSIIVDEKTKNELAARKRRRR